MHAHLHTTCAHGVAPDCIRTICTHLLAHRQVSQPKNVNGENERKLKSMRRPTYAQNTHTHIGGMAARQLNAVSHAPLRVRFAHMWAVLAPHQLAHNIVTLIYCVSALAHVTHAQ